MHRDLPTMRARIARFLDYRLPAAEVVRAIDVSVAQWTAPGEPVSFAEARAHTFQPVLPGTPWGRPWGTTWLVIQGRVPSDWDETAVDLSIELGFIGEQDGFQVEGLAYTPTGAVITGVNPLSRTVPLAPHLDAERCFTIYVEAASNPVVLREEDDALDFTPTPIGSLETAGVEPQYVLGRSVIRLIDDTVRELRYDLLTLSELAEQLPEHSARKWSILTAIGAALDALDVSDIGATARDARDALADVLASPAEASGHLLSAVGHAHIDSAWLWPFRETRRKVARTVANVLELMDADPDLIYAMSSAQQFVWLKQDHPELFERTRARVAEGRFLPVGGMWVESDVNMPSGEALVRQLLLGTRFFEQEFGTASFVGWLPDSFGYSGALPQLLAGAGISRFVTQKISWNTVNKFPHHTFWWEGIDGSRVLTHFPSADMYNSKLTGAEVAHAAANYAERGAHNQSIIPFGLGDGGGGPTREMLARATRLRNLEGSPRVVIQSPDRFFESVESGDGCPAVWLGELYLEFHRGVLTSQARMKQGNRRAERLLREAELWNAAAAVRTGHDYPYDTLESVWQRVLLLQFHDVLPGTSIAWVHAEAEAEYTDIDGVLHTLITDALAALTDGRSEVELVANAAPFAQAGVPAHAIAPVAPRQAAPVTQARGEDGSILLDNEVVRVEIASDGTIRSLIDIASGREVVPAGARFNLLQIHPDAPAMWDAWDLDESYRSRVEDVDTVDDLTVEVRGDEIAVVVTRRHRSSTIVQETIVRAGSRQIDFDTMIDWRESERLVKVSLPTTVVAERWAAETQFGHIFRPTHTNTSWDAAKFEACAHRWVHVGEPDFGVAVINEHSYGHDVRRENVAGTVGTAIGISLLRAPRFPDPETDTGVHRFRYAAVPGARIADAVDAAYRLTDARRVVRGIPVPALVTSTDPAIVIDTIKLAEDRSGDVIVRTYESLGTHVEASLVLGFPARAFVEVDLRERTIEAVDPRRIAYSPFRVRSFRITPGAR